MLKYIKFTDNMAVSRIIFVILLLLTISTELKSESSMKPKKAFTCPARRGSCDCSPLDDVIIFNNCGSKDQYTVTVNITKDEMLMDCKCKSSAECSTIFSTNMFAEFNLESIESVHFVSCPMPKISFSQMLGALNPIELSISTYVEVLRIEENFLFANLTNVTHLTIRSGKIEKLDENVFADLKNLQYLDLSTNSIEELPAGIFNNSGNLTYLSLEGNYLSKLPTIYQALPNLEILNLNSNKFNNLSENYFEFAPNLRNLTVTHNLLSIISPNAFQSLSSLSMLDLSYNELLELPSSFLESNVNLVELRIRLNVNLSALKADTFSNAKSLEILDLGRNNLTKLPADLLSHLTSLDYLDLSRNKLDSIPDNFFTDSTNLTCIDLSVNELATLPENLLKPLQRLRTINLHNNQIQSIGQDLLSKLPALTRLDLSNNEIEVIQQEAFLGSNNISWMDLSWNQIRLDSEPFTLPPAMRHVNLTHNRITFLPTKWNQAENLHSINLSENLIESVNTQELSYKSSKVIVDLTRNHIMTINLKDINHVKKEDTSSIQEYVPAIPRILVDNNPINCDCNLQEFVHFLKNKNLDPKAPFQFEANNLTCARPLNSITTNQLLYSVSEDALYCNLDDQCSQNCKCRLTPISRITEVHCEGKMLSEMIQQVPPNASKAYFDNNQLTSLEAIQDQKWKRLTEAHFSMNYISDISNKIELPTSLQVLTLDGNKLTTFPDWLMEVVNKRQSLMVTLSNNSWICDCSTLGFYHWLQTATPGKINDPGDIRCGLGKFYQKKLKLLDFTEICPHENDSSSSAITVSVLTILILLSALVFGVYCAMRHKFEIKMWLFRHRLCLWLRTEDDIESGHPL